MTTERRNPRSVDIDLYSVERILKIVNSEDALVAGAVASAIPEIAKTVALAVDALQSGGRMIYVGTGTSGRIAMLDAAECPPTFGMEADSIQAVLAGGSKAFPRAKEGLEDDRELGAADLKSKKLSRHDLVVGIAASGKTPYTLAALEYAKTRGSRTVAVVCAPDSPMAKVADLTICAIVGPEVVTGSTRMKAGTAQKMILNMVSTATMIRLGMTYSNWMINLAMTNQKLYDRGIHILREILGINEVAARDLIEKSGKNLKVAVIMGTSGCDRKSAERQLAEAKGNLRQVLGHLGSGRE